MRCQLRATLGGSVTTSNVAALAGVIVYIDIDNSNTFDDGDLFAITNASGAYAIANVPAGLQIIRQVLPTGDTQTTPSGGNGITVTVTAGESLSNENFINAVPTTGSVSGLVTTSNGAALPGVTVYVDIYNSNTFDTSDPFAITNASESFYTIANVPARSLRSSARFYRRGDSQITPSGGNGIPAKIIAGGSLSNENFIDAVSATGSVSGSAKTSGGVGIPNITIFLDANNNGVLDAGELSTTTGSSGVYRL